MTGETLLQALAARVAWGTGTDGVNGAVAKLFIIKRKAEEIGLPAAITYYAIRHHLSEAVLDVRDPSVQTFLALVEPVMNGEVQDRLTNGATDWGVPSRYPIGKPLERAAVVGQLDLWK